MKNGNRWMALVVLSVSVGMAACYGGGEAPDADDAVGEAEADAPFGEAEGALTCQGWCFDRLQECRDACPPDDPWLSTNPCLDRCYEYYGYCLDDC